MNFKLRLAFIVAITVITVSSCSKEEIIDPIDNPVDIELSSEWEEGILDSENSEIWYRVQIGEDVNQVYIEWSEKDFHGPSRDYSADIIVDAYWLDGETEYFVDKNNGYASSVKLISVSSGSGLLIRVKGHENEIGSFALKVYEKDEAGEIELIELNIGDDWHVTNIAVGEILGFLIKGGSIDQNVKIQWAELYSPGSEYTAEIKGSVYMLDLETPYLQSDNGKNFIGKDKSHYTNPKSIILDQGETEFVILINLNDPSKPGSFAIQAK